MTNTPSPAVKLKQSNLKQLSPNVRVPSYDRSELAQSIIHIGVGGFYRGHQAVYLDDLLHQPGPAQWGYCGVGLLTHDDRMRDALLPQDCLYTVVERSAANDEARVIGSLLNFLHAPSDPRAVLEKMASPECRIVSLTITEHGYYRNEATGGFNDTHPDIVHDLAHPHDPKCSFGYLVEALDLRRRREVPPFTVMSCDNLQHNGDVAKNMILAFVERRDPALHHWIAEHCTFPNSMVDRIVPATTDEHRDLLLEEFGIGDAWPVITEPFRQWVVEDNFCNGRPPWENAGVLITADVQPYEMMKIRLLNASHSAMAYLGALAGYNYVHELMADARFRRYIEALMDLEVTPLLPPVAGVDLAQYKKTTIERFANPTINDQIARLCMNGSAKLPKFILPSIRDQLVRGGQIKHLSLAVAGWCRYLADAKYTDIVDPMAETLRRQAVAAADDPAQFLAVPELFSKELRQSETFLEQFSAALRSLQTQADSVITI